MSSRCLVFITMIISSLAQFNQFLWPTWGGTISNQQRTPDMTSVNLNPANIQDIEQICQYTSEGSITMYGFATVYKVGFTGPVNAVFADFSGNIISLNLDTCIPNWIVSIQEVLEEDIEYITRNGLTLFRLSTGEEGIIFGTPNAGGDYNSMKYVVALSLETGELMWKVPLGNSPKEAYGTVHAVIVDGDYAYANMASACNSLHLEDNCKFVGRVFKIFMTSNDAILEAEWFTIPFDKQPDLDGEFDRNYYQGGGVWNWPAMIGNYFVFGSGNLYSMPDYVVDCMNGETRIFDNNPVDPCGIDQSEDYVQWRCFEDGIYPSSFNILNKNDFTHMKSVPLSGSDVFCGTDDICILDVLPWTQDWDPRCYPIEFSGADADLAAIAAFTAPGGIPRVAGTSKSGMFYVFDIPSGDVVISKKYGPWSALGGGHFSFAVSEEYQIAIAHISGGTGVYGSRLADDNFYCGGVIHGISLNTGETLYQIPNPWARYNDECQYEIFVPETGATRDDYLDFSTLNSGICTKVLYQEENPTVININITPYENDEVTPDVIDKATFFATSSISGNLLFLPSATGDIFIHDVRDGTFIHILRCPWIQGPLPALSGRRGIRAGVTVVEDRVLFVCGSYENTIFAGASTVHSWRLPQEYRSSNVEQE